MPQTIALRRGTTTVQGNGSSDATLFTQSGGIATRVVTNQLAFTFSTATNGASVVIGVYHTSSGGQTSLVGMWRNNQVGVSYRAVQFLVGSFTDNGYMGAALGSTSFPQTPCVGHQQTGDMGGTSPANVSFNYSDSSTIRFSNMPANFYIGPSDSISIKAQALDGSGNPVTTTISYSFTTITEI